MIQFLHSGLQGAPTNTIAAGSMCGILDACLVDGFNAMAPVSVTVSAGVATLVYASQHGYTADQYLRVAGASVAQVNGDKRPSILDAQTLTVPAVGAPDGAVGGSISTRFAPLGWERVFTDVNVRVYRSPNVEGSRMFYRLQDTGTSSSSPTVRGYEVMTDANTGFSPFPTVAQSANGSFFYKSNSATPRNWIIVGDDISVFFFLSEGAAPPALYPIAFGDIDSYVAGDAYRGVVYSLSGQAQEKLSLSQSSGHYVARGISQLGGAKELITLGPIVFASGSQGAYPSQASGGSTFVRPVHLREDNSLRGAVRGLMHVWEQTPCWPFAVETGIDGISGRVLICLCGVSARVAFPLDEPW